ncbi:hypothetical protein PTKIN_Ptkin02bG0116400 [Pterospermum kingtungense]
MSVIKCNTDATIFNNEGKVGFGMVIRDFVGRFVARNTSMLDGSLLVKEGKALAFLEVIRWVRSIGYTKAIFETDTKYVCDVISVNQIDISKFSSIIESHRSILMAESG